MVRFVAGKPLLEPLADSLAGMLPGQGPDARRGEEPHAGSRWLGARAPGVYHAAGGRGDEGGHDARLTNPDRDRAHDANEMMLATSLVPEGCLVLPTID
jgi:hypothetical protein